MANWRVASKVGGLLGFIGVSAAAGVLATVAITPAIAVTSMAANDTIGIFENLPSYLDIGELAQRTNIYATNSDGSDHLLASFYDQNRVEVPWEGVSGYAKDAAVAGEDPRFYDHGGIDMQGTLRAVINNVLKKQVQGGSSITQQYVKNVNIQNAIKDLTTQDEIDKAFTKATAATEERKLKEMRYAIGLEKRYSKDQILLGYLNIVHFGGRVYGVEAASNYYFNTSAANLTLPQSASLMAIVNNPEKFRLDYPDSEANGAANGYSANKDRRDYILNNMLKEKMISQQEHDDAVASPVEPAITEPSTGCQTAGGSGYFCDYITNLFENDDFFGPDVETRRHNLRTKGYQIHTTLDLDLQVAAESAINDNVPKSMDGMDIGSVAVTVQPGTGKILAMAQNKDYSSDPEVLASGPNFSAVNYATDQNYGGSSGLQPGSTFKLFTLLEWLQEGHSLNESVDAKVRTNGWGTFRDSCTSSGVVTAPSDWNPKNDEGGTGGYWTALYNTMQSENSGFVAMAKQLDLCGIRKTAEAFGVHRANLLRDSETGDPILDANGEVQYEPLNQDPSFILGTNEIAPLSMAAAYAGLAANGLYCKPIAIDRITTADGQEVPAPPVSCNQAIDPAVAAAGLYALNKAFTGGTGVSSKNKMDTGVPMFSKTGTTDNNEATWMTGGSTKAATAVGVFNASGHVNLRTTKINGNQLAVLRHNIWPRIMQLADDKWGGDPFPDPSATLLQGKSVSVPNVVGLSLEQAKSVLQGAGFTFLDGGPQDSNQPVGTVIGASPTGSAPKGAAVSVFTSNGALLTVPDAVTGRKNAGEARGVLAASGFVNVQEGCVVATEPSQHGTPVRQDPGPGTAARADTVITITVAKPNC